MNLCRVDSDAISVLVLRAKTNRLEDLAPLMPRILELLPALRPGQSAEIS